MLLFCRLIFSSSLSLPAHLYSGRPLELMHVMQDCLCREAELIKAQDVLQQQVGGGGRGREGGRKCIIFHSEEKGM